MMDYEDEIEQLIEVLYDDESNYNNADKTSGQRCYTHTEIGRKLYALLKAEYGDKDDK